MSDTQESDKDIRLKRLRFRAWHRGFKEADLMMGHFADKHLEHLSDEELDQFEALLSAECHDLFGWIVGRAPVPAEHDHALMARIQSFEHLEKSMWEEVQASQNAVSGLRP